MPGNSQEKAGRPISTETAPALRSPIKLEQMICKTSTVCGRAFLWTGQHCTDLARPLFNMDRKQLERDVQRELLLALLSFLPGV